MNLIIAIILFFISYCGINQVILDTYGFRKNSLAVSAVLLFLYFCLAGIIILMFFALGQDWFIVYGVLLFFAFLILGLYLYRLKRFWPWIRKGFFFLLLIYICFLLYTTLFMRIGMNLNTPVLTQPFSRITEAFNSGNWLLLNHFLLNMALFAPIGFFLQSMNHSSVNGWGNAFLFGLMLSTIIEGLQMILQLGESDIDDIIANTLGCILGFLICRFWLAITQNWRL